MGKNFNIIVDKILSGTSLKEVTSEDKLTPSEKELLRKLSKVITEIADASASSETDKLSKIMNKVLTKARVMSLEELAVYILDKADEEVE